MRSKTRWNKVTPWVIVSQWRILPRSVSADPEPDRWLAFEAEAMPHVDRLFRHAMWLAGNRAEAEDLVQETLVHLKPSWPWEWNGEGLSGSGRKARTGTRNSH
jgi:Sigma-70 region 2